MKRKQNTKSLSRGKASAKTARGSRLAGAMSAGRAKKSQRVTAKSASRTTASSRKAANRKATNAKAANRKATNAKAANRKATNAKAAKPKTKGAAAGSRGLVKTMSRIKGKAPLKSTSETREKRVSTNSTKPGFGRVDTNESQRMPVEERLSPQPNKPYAGADAFKPDAKGADALMSTPPRKPIRQSRNQVGARHH